MPWRTKKVDDQKVEQLLDQSPSRTEGELADELGMTQLVIFVRLYKLEEYRRQALASSYVHPENKVRHCDMVMSWLA